MLMRPLTFKFASILWLAVLVVPCTSEAQQSGQLPRVGVIGEQSADDPQLDAFRQGLRTLGYVNGQNIVIEYRYLHGVLSQVPDLAAELLRLKVDVLVVGGTVAAQSAKAQTTKVPIVFALAADPVASGLVASLARPGSNATGLSILLPELTGKQLELLKEEVPQITRATVLYNPVNQASERAVNAVREAARSLALDLQVLEVRQSKDLAKAFSVLTAWRAGAVLVVSDPMFGSELVQLSKLATMNRLPVIYNRREFPERGGLMSYGPSFSDNYRRAATYVDRILKGAKPSDLPVEQASKFELVINLKTAKTLGLNIPQSLLLRADEVIQ